MTSWFKITSLLIFSGLLWASACVHDPLVVPDDNTPDPTDTTQTPITGIPCDPDSVYFQNQILPILISNCTESGCHNEADRADGVILTSWSRLMNTVDDVNSVNWGNNELIEALLESDPEDRMPPAPNQPLTTEQINLIKTWISQGARNNGCDENYGGCDTNNVGYSAFIQPLVQARCIGCHSGGSPSGGINLSSHASTQTVALNGKLYASLVRTANWMPTGGARLDSCTIAKVKIWVDAGAPFN